MGDKRFSLAVTVPESWVKGWSAQARAGRCFPLIATLQCVGGGVHIGHRHMYKCVYPIRGSRLAKVIPRKKKVQRLMLRKTVVTAAAAGTLLFTANATAVNEFSWTNLMLASAKLNQSFDYETYVDSYMAEYRQPVYRKYRNDEFKMQAKREETIEMMKKRINNFDIDEEYLINTSVQMGQYDFNAGSFPIQGPGPNSYFYDTNTAGEFPYRYKVSFSNTDMVGDLDMEASAAEQFVAERKDSNGNVNRELPAQLKFKIVERDSDDMLVAEFTEVTLYEERNYTEEIVTFE